MVNDTNGICRPLNPTETAMPIATASLSQFVPFTMVEEAQAEPAKPYGYKNMGGWIRPVMKYRGIRFAAPGEYENGPWVSTPAEAKSFA
jgi:hypothetical protein